MFAAQLLKPLDNVNPVLAAISLALVGGIYLLMLMPPKARRLTTSLVIALGVCGLLFAQSASAMYGPLDCCNNWMAQLGICWPISWGC